MGWFIPEYGCAQVSMNLIDLDVTPVHVAFDACDESARDRGHPGHRFGAGRSGPEAVHARRRASLSERGWSGRPGCRSPMSSTPRFEASGSTRSRAFKPKEKIIEDILAPERPLAGLTLQGFADETSRDSTAPGGGSVAALAGALAAALAAMVANLPQPKVGVRQASATSSRRSPFAGQELKQHLLDAIDEDTWSFQRLMEANRVVGEGKAGGRARGDPRRRPGPPRGHRGVPRGGGALCAGPESSGWPPRRRTPGSAPPWPEPRLWERP